MTKTTKGRILETAHKLFNERHFGNVTTAMLAEELGMAEGNLWYHFKNKRALLETITEDFLETVARLMEIAPDDSTDTDQIVGQFSTYLKMQMEVQRRFRFMYRDQADYGQHSQKLLVELPKIYARTIEQHRLFYRTMRRSAMLSADDEIIGQLSVNACFILRYGLEFYRESAHPVGEREGPLRATYGLLLSLLKPHIESAGFKILEERIDAF